jgi:hypothetical protein
METIQQQIGALQTSVKRQRLLNIALLGFIVAGGFIAAVQKNKQIVISGFKSDLGTLLITNDGQLWQYEEDGIWIESPNGISGKEINESIGGAFLQMDPDKRYIKIHWEPIESPTSY